MPIDTNDFQFFDIDHVTEAFNGAEVIKDAYWMTNKDGKIAVYKGSSPQCNVNEAVVQLLINNAGFEWAVGYEKIPLAYVGIKNGTYDRRAWRA